MCVCVCVYVYVCECNAMYVCVCVERSTLASTPSAGKLQAECEFKVAKSCNLYHYYYTLS